MRIAFAVLFLAVGCVGGDDGPVETGDPIIEACDLAEEFEVCPECYSGEILCEYGSFSVTVASCGECQSRGALYAELCDAGVTDSREDIEAGTVCDI